MDRLHITGTNHAVQQHQLTASAYFMLPGRRPVTYVTLPSAHRSAMGQRCVSKDHYSGVGEEDEMNHNYAGTSSRDKCPQCGSPIMMEMDGPWSYRVCARNGHRQGYGSSAGPLAGAAMLHSARI